MRVCHRCTPLSEVLFSDDRVRSTPQTWVSSCIEIWAIPRLLLQAATSLVARIECEVTLLQIYTCMLGFKSLLRVVIADATFVGIPWPRNPNFRSFALVESKWATTSDRIRGWGIVKILMWRHNCRDVAVQGQIGSPLVKTVTIPFLKIRCLPSH